MKKLSLMLALFLLPVVVYGADPSAERSHWSLELKGGMFYPDIENWKNYYGSDKTSHYAAALAYKLFRQLEVGIEGGYIRDKGQGLAPGHGTTAGSVTYELFPLEAFILLRGVFSERQWLVPYAGGGWTRMYYQEKIEFQDTIKGYTDGYHGRAGIQLLLDGLDQDAANSFYLEYGVHHTYLFFEAQYTRAMIEDLSGQSINLGGTSYLAGLLFEF
ncbi:MAG: MXAN_2562 family outer membrane beta-barrel protein [Nitrospirota bacterium]